ncbi:MAG: transcriptional regulator, GntR family with aminotransferase domain, partial [Flaviaesturariibacter sp.]|nr:transcriptional regulator, GntR family with aminotransferase domain [Flaviaesturariibacter sp.]
MQPITPQTDFLYNQIVNRISDQIRMQVLKAGDKLLSVRSFSKEQNVSMSTVFKAYGELEIKGLIEARPKSGYYVKLPPRAFRPVERQDPPMPDLKEASADDMIALVYRHLSEEKVVRLSLSAPSTDLLPAAKLSKSLAEVVRQSKTSCMHYESVQGNPVLRKQVARLCFNWGGTVSEDQVITTQGCMEALVFCLKAVTVPGDTVAIESPTYFGIFSALKAQGLRVLEIPSHPATGMSIDALQDAIDNFSVKACLVTSNFTNPTGALMPDASKERLVKMLAKRSIPLIEDDIYGEMYFDSSRPRTCKSFDRQG